MKRKRLLLLIMANTCVILWEHTENTKGKHVERPTKREKKTEEKRVELNKEVKKELCRRKRI